MWVAFHFQRRFPFLFITNAADVLVPTDRSLASRRHGSHVQISATHLVSGLSIATLLKLRIIFIFCFICVAQNYIYEAQDFIFLPGSPCGCEALI
jgi:hypothetical protein